MTAPPRFFRVKSGSGASWARQAGEGLALLDRAPWEAARPTGAVVPLAQAELLAPATPTKIVAIGLNYRDHAAERGKALPAEPLIFIKPETAVIGPDEAIRRPAWAGRIDHEAEMAIVIEGTAHDLPSPAEARAHIFAVTCLNDVTARELQDKDVQFTRAKGFDTFCPIGPCLVGAKGLDLGNLSVTGRVNGQVRQKSTTAQLIFPSDHLVWFVSRVMTLRPGDIISTGTPAGIGPLQAGDVVEVEVGGVGVLKNPVV